MKKVFVFASLLSLFAYGKDLAQTQCPPQKVVWDKCQAFTQPMDNSKSLWLRTSTNPNECYGWVGKVEVTCENSKLKLNSKTKKCIWDCLCCY